MHLGSTRAARGRRFRRDRVLSRDLAVCAHRSGDRNNVMKVLKATWDRFSAKRGVAPWRRPSPTGLCSPWPPCWSSAVAVAGAIFGEEAASGELAISTPRVSSGTDIAAGGRGTRDFSASGSQAAGWIGVVIFIWAGSGLFVEFQGALRVIYDIAAERMRGIWNAVQSSAGDGCRRYRQRSHAGDSRRRSHGRRLVAGRMGGAGVRVAHLGSRAHWAVWRWRSAT